MLRIIPIAFILLMWLSGVSALEPVIGGPCEGCEYVFSGLPGQLKSNAVIAPAEAKGEALVLQGTVYKSDGAAAVGVIVYAYQTDANGVYPKGSTRHGSLRGWARTDQNGRYSFMTVRPGAYPGRGIPQHIHMHIIEPDKATYYIDDVTFDDDPLLSAEHRQKQNCRGGCGQSHPERNEHGIWHVRRDITLGEAIPGYR